MRNMASHHNVFQTAIHILLTAKCAVSFSKHIFFKSNCLTANSPTPGIRRNRRKSELRSLQNRFLGCFSHFCDSKFRFLIANRESVCGRLRYHEPALWVMSMANDSTLAANSDLFASRCDLFASRCDLFASRCDLFASRCDFFAYVRATRKNDLRRIVCDFLTIWHSCG